jgi:DDE superfamily endonuclease
MWKAFNLQPHRTETFKLSADPLFVEKVRDAVGLYLAPPERAVAPCVDEKSQIQALDRSQPLLPMRPGQIERRTHDCIRHGTLPLFAALDATTGSVIGRCHPPSRGRQFLSFLRKIERNVPNDLDVHLIMDNDATHKTEPIQKWLGRAAEMAGSLRPDRPFEEFSKFYAEWAALRSRRRCCSGRCFSRRSIRSALSAN